MYYSIANHFLKMGILKKLIQKLEILYSWILTLSCGSNCVQFNLFARMVYAMSQECKTNRDLHSSVTAAKFRLQRLASYQQSVYRHECLKGGMAKTLQLIVCPGCVTPSIVWKPDLPRSYTLVLYFCTSCFDCNV